LQEAPWRFTKGLYSKKGREESGLTVAEGPPSVVSALEAGISVEYLMVQESFAASLGYGRIAEPLTHYDPRPSVYVIADSLYGRMSEVKSPQGVLRVLPFPFRHPEEQPKSPWAEPLYVYAFDIQDPGNAGTLIRAAAAAGATGVVFCGESADVFSPKCIRSSAGASFRVNLREDASTDHISILRDLQSEGISVYKAVPRGGIAPWEADFSKGSAIVVGNEARGLSEEVLRGPGRTVTIPMPGDTESLNVAIASGAILYEAVRQRFLSKAPA